MPCGLHLLGQSGGTAGVCEFVTVEGWDIPGGKHRNDVEKPGKNMKTNGFPFAK